MPPFSGKQKKKQLQEKRLRKKQQDNNNNNNNEPVVESEHRPKSNNNNNNNNIKDEYKYGADRQGIRSVFLKETTEEVAARKKLSYAPLYNRQFMTEAGIPFGSWFIMPGHHSEAAPLPFSVEMPTRGWETEELLLKNLETYINNNNNNSNIEDENSSKDNNSSSDDNNSSSSSHNDNDTSPIHTELEIREVKRFEAYIQAVDNFKLPPHLTSLKISSYERNLDVWRQLWRTVEQSDVVVIVTDVRYPIVHLPISLLYYIVIQSNKPCAVILNKADLVPQKILDKWMSFLPLYFKANNITKDIPLIPFTSLPAEETAIGAEDAGNAARRRKKKSRRTKLYEQLRTGKLQLANELKEEEEKKKKKKNQIPNKNSNSSDDNDNDNESDDDDDDDESDNESDETENNFIGYEDRYASTENFKGMRKAERNLQHDKRGHKELQIVSDMISSLLRQCRTMSENKNNNKNKSKDKDKEEEEIVHIGVVGHPNVGKSSLLNCIRGTKVVSVSATAGHTKHLQTIPLPNENIILIDSPGLAFPVFGLPRALQAVIGTHQIAQTRDPQSGVAFLASHLQLERLYGLRKIDDSSPFVGYNNNNNNNNNGREAWSPYEICESYAKKKGYFVKHGKGALDVHRGSIEILQEAYEGRLVLFFAPPDAKWLESEEFTEKIRPYLRMEVQLSESNC